MATRSTGGATLELIKQSEINLQRQFKKLDENSNNAYRGVVKLLFQIKTIAQQKLKSDKHIITSRLRNSIYVQTPNQEFAKQNGNEPRYSDNIGNSYDAEIKGVAVQKQEGIVGTNVKYAPEIEFMNDSFLYYGMKHADIDRMGREIAKELLNGIV